VLTRPSTPADDALLFELYSRSRADEFALMPLPPEQLQFLARMQFDSQHSSYRMMYPGTAPEIVLKDSAPAGIFWIAVLENEIRIVDIAIVPECRRMGIATALYEGAMSLARQSRKPVRASVVRFNSRSVEFHRKLGFVFTEDDEIYWGVEWTASSL
jgi:ribosomal protein S18 acetylase RimI-like enzyme